MKKQKGITLIALIITIIVMLILVGVSVTVALKGGLFTTAQDAADRTKAERDNELAISNGDIIDQYLSGNENGTASGKWKLGENDTLEYVDAEGKVTKTTIKIGDAVNYDEGTTGSYTIDLDNGIAAVSNEQMDMTNGNTYFTYEGGILTVSGENNTLEAGDLDWKVIGVNNLGQIELVGSSKMKNGFYITDESIISTKLSSICNDICNSLYGSGHGATSARSISKNDFNKLYSTYPATSDYLAQVNDYNFMELSVPSGYDHLPAVLVLSNGSEFLWYGESDRLDGGFIPDLVVESNSYKSIGFYYHNPDSTNSSYTGIVGPQIVTYPYSLNTGGYDSHCFIPVVTLDIDVEFTEPDANGVYSIK